MTWEDWQGPSAHYYEIASPNGGICLSLSRLMQRGELEEKLMRKMHDRLMNHCPYNLNSDRAHGHWWAFNKPSAKERAEFCWRMAEECEREGI